MVRDEDRNARALRGYQGREQAVRDRMQHSKNPGRNVLHYDEDYGTVTSAQGSQRLREGDANMKKHVAETTNVLNKAKSNLLSNFESANSKLLQARDAALSKLPRKKSLDAEWYNFRRKYEPVGVWSRVYRPKNDANYDGTSSGVRRDPKDFVYTKLDTMWVPPGSKARYLEKLIQTNQFQTDGNRVIIAGRVSDRLKALRQTQRQAEAEWQSKWMRDAGSQISKYNKSIDKAKSNISSQFGTQYNNLLAQKAKGLGEIKGRRQGLQNELEAWNGELKSIRTSFQDRMKNLHNALQLSAGGGGEAGWNSTSAPPKPIDPRAPSAQGGERIKPKPIQAG